MSRSSARTGRAWILAALVLASRPAGAQRTGPGQATLARDRLAPVNRLAFPYGVQCFEREEGLELGDPVTRIPGWRIVGSSASLAACVEGNADGSRRPGTSSRRWLCVEDAGRGAANGLYTPPLEAPSPWNYSWTFDIQVVSPPLSAMDAPVLAIQHREGAGFQDAWGVRLTPGGAELFVSETWGQAASASLFSYSGATQAGTWIRVRIETSLGTRTLAARVDGTEAARLSIAPAPSVDRSCLRLAYHGGGAGNPATLLLDDVGIAFLSFACELELDLDLTSDDDGDALADGEDIAATHAFGRKLTLAGTGPNRGAAIFDSSNPGPNASGPAAGLLVRRGNVLILQSDTTPPSVSGEFPVPDDDADGGVLSFAFLRPLRPSSITLIDMDSAVIRLTDFSGLVRTYAVPPGWTGDITQGAPGVRTLDLATLAPQPGIASTATAAEDPAFDPGAVVSMTATLGGSGALDDLRVLVPCTQLTFDVEDDATPLFAGTALSNGQDVSSPPEFGNEVALVATGPNAGAAVFDSTQGGPNHPGPDIDLLVGLGNILILQNDLFPLQTAPGFFDTPNDDQNGGMLHFFFPRPVECFSLDLIDVTEEDPSGVVITLIDTRGRTRVFDVPPGWTEGLLNDGPPAFRTLDLQSPAAQPGFVATARTTEAAGFDVTEVIQITLSLGGTQALDNLCFLR